MNGEWYEVKGEKKKTYIRMKHFFTIHHPQLTIHQFSHQIPEQ
jgi:hypothetical protein